VNFLGRPVEVRFLPSLTASRGRLLTRGEVGSRGRLRGEGGSPVHAATFIRKRVIVLDSALLRDRDERTRILLHELFHFVWTRLGNPARLEWERLLRTEFVDGTRGELGWSAECRKQALTGDDRRARSRRWREYACESFCDTAAWLFGACRRHAEYTLPAGARDRRRRWFAATLDDEALPI
jgi:hypothetical protein